MSTKVVNCPQCQTPLTVATELAPGKGLRCPKCQLKFIPPQGTAARTPTDVAVSPRLILAILLVVGLGVSAVVWYQLAHQSTPPPSVAGTIPSQAPHGNAVSPAETPVETKKLESKSVPEPEVKNPPTPVPPSKTDDDLPDIPLPMTKKGTPKSIAETQPQPSEPLSKGDPAK
ncbi:MAG: zinc-ribbon domain-containing protein, partial [Gemmataceae bacterium]|nr:zinc-ribbon domain-containing protein [Gemmataceae bacterium]